MITMLETIGPVIWRASWQAAALAVLVTLLVRCFGERLAPRWRFLLWGVVLARFLVVATPSSPWSVFNVARGNGRTGPAPMIPHETNPTSTPASRAPELAAVASKTHEESPRATEYGAKPSEERAIAAAETSVNRSESETAWTQALRGLLNATSTTRSLSLVWFTGCLLLGLRLLATAIVLRRRLTACRRVSDGAILELLETSCRRIGLRRTPTLLVSPESLSPCTVGTWNPTIVLPESIVTDGSTERLRHVMAHELAHVIRGDLWTNWLMLTARTVHWFNPLSWWIVREMQGERESACDELAFAVLGEADRTAYAATIVELAASLRPAAIAPGFVGLFSSTCRLKTRVERLLRSPSVKILRAPMAASVLLGFALMGLTDAMPGAKGEPAKKAASKQKNEPKSETYTLSGSCVDHTDHAPLPGVTVRLYKVEGRTSPPTEVARTVTGVDGRWAFTGLVPPRPESHLDYLDYAVIGFTAGRPIGARFIHFGNREMVSIIRIARDPSSISGKVIDTSGRPVVGATVFQVQHTTSDWPLPGFPSAVTDTQGRFKLDQVAVYKAPDGTIWDADVTVRHPDFPEATAKVKALPANVAVTLPAGCVVTGTVVDKIAGKPAAGALIMAQRVDEWGETFAASDEAGRFRFVVPEGRYNVLVEAKDRVCIGVGNREFLAAETVELPQFTLIRGGFISGQVVNTPTGQAVSVSESGEPIMIGLFGPSRPSGKVVSPVRMAAVDKSGRFIVRAAPGNNYPYFVNTHGARMAWDTQKQAPVVVKDGETTTYNMLITPPVPLADKQNAAQRLVRALSKVPSERTAQILLEFRKLNHTVDETELWCLLMRELVAVGREAVPQLSNELDRTTEDRALRRLGFALRAIGDPRAMPALIRAIPRTLLPSSSDYGLTASDKKVHDFMRKYDLDKGMNGEYFTFGRPGREIFGALHTLSGKYFHDAAVFGICLSEDPRRQVLQRRLYGRQSRRWQEWWEKNWQKFTKDAAYQKVNLKLVDEPLPPAPQALGKTARLSPEVIGAVLTPPREEAQYVGHFTDLDTGYQPNWPAHIPRDESAGTAKQLADWALQSGVDLMCVTRRLPSGGETYVLKAFGMRVREITTRELRNLNDEIAAGRLPEGRPVGELLMHYDSQTQQLVLDANGAFVFVTREGNIGLIEVTDRVTLAADLTGTAAGSPPPGVGFHKGVRFNQSAIIP